MGKVSWKCLDYSENEISKLTDADLKATTLTEWGSCRLEKPPKEFGKFCSTVVMEMKKRGIDYTKFIG